MSAGDVQVAIEAIRTVASDRHLLLLSDFDGTLCEFDPDPEAVRLPEVRRALLEAIGSRVDATIALVSGRRLADVRLRAALTAPAYYAGLHGLEIEGPTERFRHPELDRARTLLRALAEALSPEVARFKGAFIEDKEFSIAAHFREASTEDAARVVDLVARAALRHVDAGELRLMRGACNVELLPNIGWHKGSAVEWIRERVAAHEGDAWPLYIGDDLTDEDAFRAVRGHGVSVSAASRASGADFFIDGPGEVETLLRALS